jgi:hypothetical protein
LNRWRGFFLFQIKALDAGGEMTTPTTDPGQDPENPGQDPEAVTAAQAAAAIAAKEAEAEEAAMEAAAEAAAAKGDTSLKKFLFQKRAANKEARELKELLKTAKATQKERDALAAKVKKYEDEKKTEAERQSAAAKEAVERADTAEAKVLNLERVGDARDAGVSAKYRDYAVSEFAKAASKDSETDPEEFYKTFKADHPAMFNGKKPADPTAKGGPGTPAQPDEVTAAITELEEKIKTAGKKEKLWLVKRRNSLINQKGAAK